eukprot:269300-Pelagomonas_calceolata.AAC.10
MPVGHWLGLFPQEDTHTPGGWQALPGPQVRPPHRVLRAHLAGAACGGGAGMRGPHSLCTAHLQRSSTHGCIAGTMKPCQHVEKVEGSPKFTSAEVGGVGKWKWVHPMNFKQRNSMQAEDLPVGQQLTLASSKQDLPLRRGKTLMSKQLEMRHHHNHHTDLGLCLPWTPGSTPNPCRRLHSLQIEFARSSTFSFMLLQHPPRSTARCPTVAALKSL